MALLNEINVKGVPHPIVTDDGYYQEMTVGDAEQLVATTFTEDDAPYNFRTAGGAIDIGDRKQVEGIVGGTVAWNQLLPLPSSSRSFTRNNVTLTDNRDGSFTVQTTSEGASAETSLTITSTTSSRGNHVGLLIGCPAGGWSGAYKYRLLEAWGLGQDYGNGKVGRFVANGNYDIRIAINSGTIITTPIKFVPQFFDLTQMFGSTIADYIYSLEQATAGAGVAWFKKYFPKPYYEYNAGELMSVKALRHITRGFNAWDEEWEIGGLTWATGEEYSASDRIRSKNYQGCIGGALYFGNNAASIFFYDANYQLISYGGFRSEGNTTRAPLNARWFKIVIMGTSYGNNLCINLSWDGERDGEYEEYVEHVYELDPDLELRGIPKLSAGNDLYYDGDVYEPDGTVTRKYGILTITANDVSLPNNVYENIQYARIAKPSDSIALGKAWTRAINSKFVASGANNDWDTADKVNGFFGGADYQWYWFGFAAGTTLEQAKAALAGTVVVYELAEPTEETADPYNGTQIVDDFGTEEFVDAGVAASTPTRDVAIPVGHNSLYQPNLRAKLEMVPEAPEDEGYYVVYHHDGINEYVPLIIPQELPNLPSEDGTYTLKCTVASGSATLSFESEV